MFYTPSIYLQYMIDVDMVKLLPQAFEDFQQSFKLPGTLPGGSHCMMNAVSSFLVVFDTS